MRKISICITMFFLLMESYVQIINVKDFGLVAGKDAILEFYNALQNVLKRKQKSF